ncbi:hypothetical protein [Dyadobacter sandarakinus]|uniref:Restriction endonuclease n=1 Tax=Dyadobacter sandarakinus TaxID=2747268 RepID=A0ABX7I451_9BACT|nr:hypothetical protein [Dyadobacter sandarakinus]QRR00871.1 hypothetical protein HWI92_08110 [Dyadobacter sandarakinus]
MSELLEITEKDIAELNDSDLRGLIGLLCEAECRKNGISTKAIQWGGPQDAPDDGIDVSVASEIQFPTGSYIPRSNVIFQSKVTDMSPSLIRKEMNRSGQLRDSIRELTKTGGAYIVVSGHSLETKRCNVRIAEMKKIVGELNIMVDYYHGGRIASWVRENPSMILWVRQRAKRPIYGWQSYNDWTFNLGTGETYILDQDCRLVDKRNGNSLEMTIESGISEMRNLLSKPGNYLRLTGLSGVGKTRLAQALFDESIGDNQLNQSTVIYTDISFDPKPSPQNLIEQLVAGQNEVILIIDNCTPTLHSDLVNKLKIQPHSISLLTIEYDVRDDLPDETGVFHLEPSSDQLIQKLVLRQFPKISELDAWKIAEVSGGNARVAIALANTVKPGESIGHLRNNQLFDRLFNQRNPENESLKNSAEILSLVYSYDIENSESENSELGVLSAMSSITAHTLFKHTVDLKDRDLVQSRGKFRAVLPHAIANKLAIRGLAFVTNSSIDEYLLREGNERMIRSFSRRLSYIPDNERAQDIVKNWLAPNTGWMNDVSDLSEFGLSVFENLATIAPEHALAAIERAALLSERFASRDNRHFSRFFHLLRHIAYDGHLFVRSTNVMAAIAISEKIDESYNPVREDFTDMFHIVGSGTYAPLNSRLQVINLLWEYNDTNKQQLAIELIDAALEAWHLQPRRSPSFGSKSRDFGVVPKNSDERKIWFVTVVEQCIRMFNENTPFKAVLSNILASKLRGIWTKARLFDVVQSICEQMTQNGFWAQGWLKFLSIIRFDLKKEAAELQQRLTTLEKSLQPKSLHDKLVVYFLTDAKGADLSFALTGDDKINFKELFEIVESLGNELINDHYTSNKAIPLLLCSENGNLFHLGRGMYWGVSDKQTGWNNLLSQYLRLPPEKRKPVLLKGWINRAYEDNELYSDEILKHVLKVEDTKHLFFSLQASIPVSQNGMALLEQTLEDLEFDSDEFKSLAYSLVNSTIPTELLTNIVRKILNRPGGQQSAFEIIYSKCWVIESSACDGLADELVEIGRRLLVELDLDRELRSEASYKVDTVIQRCFKGEDAFKSANEFSTKLFRLFRKNYGFASRATSVLIELTKVQPICFLNGLLERSNHDEDTEWFIADSFEEFNLYISRIPNDLIINWCNEDPHIRYKFMGGAMVSFEGNEEVGNLIWKPIFWRLVENAPNIMELLDAIEGTLRPLAVVGSRTNAYRARLTLFSTLFDNPNEEISQWARSKFRQWNKDVESERKHEEERNQYQNESFE